MVQQQLQQSSGSSLQSHASLAAVEQNETAAAGVPYLSEADVHGRGRRGENME